MKKKPRMKYVYGYIKMLCNVDYYNDSRYLVYSKDSLLENLYLSESSISYPKDVIREERLEKLLG